jgi:hypothetical protein
MPQGLVGPLKCLSLYPWSDEALREVHLYLEQYLKRNFERFDSPRPWMDSGELPQNPATLYGRAFMPVKYAAMPTANGHARIRGRTSNQSLLLTG